MRNVWFFTGIPPSVGFCKVICLYNTNYDTRKRDKSQGEIGRKVKFSPFFLVDLMAISGGCFLSLSLRVSLRVSLRGHEVPVAIRTPVSCHCEGRLAARGNPYLLSLRGTSAHTGDAAIRISSGTPVSPKGRISTTVTSVTVSE